MNALLHGIRAKFSDVCHISTETLAEWRQSSKGDCGHEESSSGHTPENVDVLVIDARPEEEYLISHIDGSIRMEHDDEATIRNFVKNTLKTPSATGEMTTVGKAVVCYCSLGYRSSMLARTLKKEVIDQNLEGVKVYNLDGSLFKWANEARPLVNGDGTPTIYAHPYNTVFGMTLKKELRKYK